MHSYAMSLVDSATLHPSIVTLSSSSSEHGVLGWCFSLLPIVWDSGGGMCACLKLSSSRPSLSTLVYTRWYIYDPPPLPSQSSRPAFTINHYSYHLHQKSLLESSYHRLRHLLPPPPPLRWTNYLSSRPTTTTNDHHKKPQAKRNNKQKKCLFPSPPVELPPKAIPAPTPTPPPTPLLAAPPSTKLFSRRLYPLPHAKTIMLFRNRFVRRDCW